MSGVLILGRWMDTIAVRAAVALAAVLAVAAGLVAAAGADPVAAAVGMLGGAFGERYMIAETLVAAVPLALVALGVAPALRAGVFTVGSEGQLVVGAVSATAAVLAGAPASPWLLVPLGCLAGIVGGMAWALIPAMLRAYFRVNEILSTLLLNYVAGYGLVWLLRTGLSTADQVATPRSDHLPAEALVPKLLEGTRLHWGLVVVLLGAVALAWWLRTGRGLVYDLVATRPALSARLGLGERRAVIATMLVSGAAAGVAGWLQVAGITSTLYPSVGGGLGFAGILVALLGGLRPAGILVAAVFFSALTTGADGLQAGTGVPSSIATVIEGVLLLAAALVFAERRRSGSARPVAAPAVQPTRKALRT